MLQPTTVVSLTKDKLPVFLAIFGEMEPASPYRGRRSAVRQTTTETFEFLREHSATDAEMCWAQCVDISEDGIGFRCQEHLRLGERIQLYFSGETQEYMIQAEVMHVMGGDGNPCRVGARFTW
ncbi:MAG: PilZ domain-containing protein [Phycisphaerae bacterium]|nr:PilZ domain-containing protein [Phycisphaerae bacterium]